MNNIPTFFGLLAIIFWSSSVAIIKSLSVKVGSIMPAVFVYISGGIVLLIWDYLTEKRLSFLSFSKNYLLVCGISFIVCMLTFYLAIGFASSQVSVIGVGLVNYTWPSLTLILSIPILQKRAKPNLILGILLATLGVFLAANPSGGVSLTAFFQSIRVDALGYAFAAVAALSWSFYSNYSIKLGKEIKGNSIYVFMLATGLIALPYYLYFENLPSVDSKTVIELIVLTVANTLAYLFWDIAIRKGNMALVSSLAYLTPLLSTICSCLYLGLSIEPKILLACILIILGAVVCSKSVS